MFLSQIQINNIKINKTPNQIIRHMIFKLVFKIDKLLTQGKFYQYLLPLSDSCSVRKTEWVDKITEEVPIMALKFLIVDLYEIQSKVRYNLNKIKEDYFLILSEILGESIRCVSWQDQNVLFLGLQLSVSDLIESINNLFLNELSSREIYHISWFIKELRWDSIVIPSQRGYFFTKRKEEAGYDDIRGRRDSDLEDYEFQQKIVQKEHDNHHESEDEEISEKINRTGEEIEISGEHGLTLREVTRSIYYLKRHKRDYWYELFAKILLRHENTDFVEFEVIFDYGS